MFQATERWGFLDHGEATKKKTASELAVKKGLRELNVDHGSINEVIMPGIEFPLQIYWVEHLTSTNRRMRLICSKGITQPSPYRQIPFGGMSTGMGTPFTRLFVYYVNSFSPVNEICVFVLRNGTFTHFPFSVRLMLFDSTV